MFWILYILIFIPLYLNTSIQWPRLKYENYIFANILLLTLLIIFSPVSFTGLIPDAIFLYLTYFVCWIKLSRIIKSNQPVYRFAVITVIIISLLIPVQAFFGGMGGSWYLTQDLYNTKKIQFENGCCIVTKVERSNFNYPGTVNVYLKLYPKYFPVFEYEYYVKSFGKYNSPHLPVVHFSPDGKLVVVEK